MKNELIVRTTDSKASLSLPRGFADVTVLIERISESEIRIRKAKVVPEDEVEFHFAEESLKPLSDRDRDLFLNSLDSPPAPPGALIRSLQRAKKIADQRSETNDPEEDQIVPTGDTKKNPQSSRTPKHTELFGYSITAVIRWMGKNGWKLEEARKALGRLEIHCADATVKTQLSAGSQGTRGEPAPLTSDEIQTLDEAKKQ